MHAQMWAAFADQLFHAPEVDLFREQQSATDASEHETHASSNPPGHLVDGWLVIARCVAVVVDKVAPPPPPTLRARVEMRVSVVVDKVAPPPPPALTPLCTRPRPGPL